MMGIAGGVWLLSAGRESLFIRVIQTVISQKVKGSKKESSRKMIHYYICSAGLLWAEGKTGWKMTHKNHILLFSNGSSSQVLSTSHLIICISMHWFREQAVSKKSALVINTSFAKFQMTRSDFYHSAVNYGNHVVFSEKVVFFSISYSVCMNQLQPVAFCCCRVYVIVIDVVAVFHSFTALLQCLCNFVSHCALWFSSAQLLMFQTPKGCMAK